METFEDWLDTVPSLALRELAGGGYSLRALPVERVREMVLEQPDLRARAERSWETETRAREAYAAMDPRAVRAAKMRHGLVD